MKSTFEKDFVIAAPIKQQLVELFTTASNTKVFITVSTEGVLSVTVINDYDPNHQKLSLQKVSVMSSLLRKNLYLAAINHKTDGYKSIGYYDFFYE